MRVVIAVLVLFSATLLLSFRVFDGSTEGPEPSVQTIASGEFTSAGLSARPQDGRVTGSVRVVSGPDTQAVQTARVWVSDTRIKGLTDREGQFGFRLPPGDYTARAETPGFDCPPFEFSVLAGESASIVFICPDVLVQSPDTVSISVDTITGIVTVSPDPLYIAPNDCIAWKSSDGPWAVHFSPISPITHRRIRAAADSSVVECVRSDVFPGKYSYLVAVAVGNSIYTEDPELIDENEDG